MVISAVSYKPCWKEDGEWYSSGGFPHQMNGIASPYSLMYLLVPAIQAEGQKGGIKLADNIVVVPIQAPKGSGPLRKLFILTFLPYYLWKFYHYFRKSSVVHTPLPGDVPLLAFLFALISRKKILARYGSSWKVTNQTSSMHRFTKGAMKFAAKLGHVMLVTGTGEVPPAPGVEWIFSTSLSADLIEAVSPNCSETLSPVPQLVYIGRLSTEKGVHVLLEALGKIKKREPELKFKLNLIGDGPERKKLSDHAANLDLDSSIIFHGQLNQTELFDLLPKMDFCVQPSLTEGFSKAWLDAMLCGLPVLSSNVGAAESVIGNKGERGWLVQPGDSNELGERIFGLLTVDTLEFGEMRKACRSYVSDKTLEKWAAKIREICRAKWEEIQ